MAYGEGAEDHRGIFRRAARVEDGAEFQAIAGRLRDITSNWGANLFNHPREGLEGVAEREAVARVLLEISRRDPFGWMVDRIETLQGKLLLLDCIPDGSMSRDNVNNLLNGILKDYCKTRDLSQETILDVIDKVQMQKAHAPVLGWFLLTLCRCHEPSMLRRVLQYEDSDFKSLGSFFIVFWSNDYLPAVRKGNEEEIQRWVKVLDVLADDHRFPEQGDAKVAELLEGTGMSSWLSNFMGRALTEEEELDARHRLQTDLLRWTPQGRAERARWTPLRALWIALHRGFAK
jgi:hypothetical protein